MKARNIMIILVVLLALPAAIATEVADTAALKFPGVSSWDDYDVSYTQVNQDPDPAEPGKLVDIKFKVQNIGSTIAKGAKFKVVEDFPFSVYDPSKKEIKIGDIDARQVGNDAYILTYRLKIDDNAVDGDNKIYLKYSLNDGANWVTVGPYIVKLRAKNPVLAISSVESVPSEITPGERFKLKLNLKNTAFSVLTDVTVKLSVWQVYALTTTVTESELPFSPVDSANEKYIGTVGENKDLAVEFDLLADPDAESKVYKLPVTIRYSDKAGMNYTKSYVASIVVNDKPDIAVFLDSTDIKTKGQSGKASIKFVNKGGSDLQFFFVQLDDGEGYEVTSSKDVYLGKIDSDDYQTADFDITVKSDATQSLTLPIKYEYRDALNNKIYSEKEVVIPLYSASEAADLGYGKKSNATGIIVVIIIIAVGLGAYFFLKKRSKKKK